MAYRISPLHSSFAIEVTELDASRAIDEKDCAGLLSLLHNRLVILLRKQKLTLPQLLEFTSRFGTVDFPWDGSHGPDDPRVQIISNIRRETIHHKTATLYWHTDNSFTRTPTMFTMLYATAVPPEGGDTLFANMREAYDRLPTQTQTELCGLRARHSFEFRLKGLLARRSSEAVAAEMSSRFPDVFHPLVRSHPTTGQKAIYLNELCLSGIRDLSQPEADILLQKLYHHALSPDLIYRHHWEVGDVLIWDNASLMHRAADIPAKPLRFFYRTNTVGVVPH